MKENKENKEDREGFFTRMKTADKKGFEITMFVISILVAFIVAVSFILLLVFWNSPGEDKVTDEEADAVIVTGGAIEATAAPSPTPFGDAIIHDDNLDGEYNDMIEDDLDSYKSGYTTATVNMRSEASLTASVVTKVPADTKVKFIKLHDKEWMEVNYNGRKGFINAMYLSATKPQPTRRRRRRSRRKRRQNQRKNRKRRQNQRKNRRRPRSQRRSRPRNRQRIRRRSQQKNRRRSQARNRLKHRKLRKNRNGMGKKIKRGYEPWNN